MVQFKISEVIFPLASISFTCSHMTLYLLALQTTSRFPWPSINLSRLLLTLLETHRNPLICPAKIARIHKQFSVHHYDVWSQHVLFTLLISNLNFREEPLFTLKSSWTKSPASEGNLTNIDTFFHKIALLLSSLLFASIILFDF